MIIDHDKALFFISRLIKVYKCKIVLTKLNVSSNKKNQMLHFVRNNLYLAQLIYFIYFVLVLVNVFFLTHIENFKINHI